MNSLFIVMISFVSGFTSVQQFEGNCNSSEASQFDFWIGEWKAEWENSDGEKITGTNKITKILGSCVIEENFNGNPGNNLIGKSFTVFNKHINKWQQTWVDNYGSYMNFTGEYKDEKMILEREVNSDGNILKQRMVFYNIKKDSFIWDWEKSTDNGKNWELAWKIYYSRIKK